MPRRDFYFFFFQLVKKLSDLTGCTQVVDVGSGQVSQSPGKEISRRSAHGSRC